MSTYTWSVPTGNTITGTTYIKDTDNKIQATIDDLVEFVNGEGSHSGQGLTYDFVDKDSAQTITGVKTFGNGIIGDVTGNVTGSVVGNASTSTKLATARNINLIGDTTGTALFDGSGDISISTTVADDSHNHTISNVDGLQTALDGKQAVGSYVTTTSAQSLHSTDALRISGNTVSLFKGNGASESVTIPSDISAYSNSSNGYVKLGNSLTLEWGNVSVSNNSSATVTLPRALTGTFIAMASTNDYVYYGEGNIGASFISGSQISVRNGQDFTLNIDWFVIGIS